MSRGAHPRNRRSVRGAVLVAVMVGLVITATLVASMVQRIGIQRQRLRQQARQHQTWWLCDAGARRAVAAVRADRAYEGEVWQIAADQLHSASGAKVDITVSRDEQGIASVNVVARFPADSPQAVQVSKSFRLAGDMQEP